MSYEPHEHLVTPARLKPQVWRIALGLFLGFIAYIALSLAYGYAGQAVLGQAFVANAFNGVNTGPGEIYFLMGTFVFMLVGGLVAAAVHQRGLRDLLGGYRRTISSFLNALVGIAPVLFILIIMGLVLDRPALNVAPVLWALLLPVSLSFLLIQVSAEEVIFRGYLQSQLAALNIHPALWIIIPSVLFGMAHYDPATMGKAAPWIVVWAALFGVLAADLTARTGSLGPAIAMHFANNFAALLIFGFPDYLGGLALFVLDTSVTDTDALLARLPLDALSMGLLYLAIRLRLKV